MKANLLRNKVVVITNGDTELSQKVAIEMALMKSEVILIGKKKENLEKPVKELEATKKKAGRINPVVADWNNAADIDKTMMLLKKIAGGFDMVVFNTSNPSSIKIEDMKNTDIEKVVDKELKTNLIFIKTMLKEVKNSKKPAVITISDFMGSVGVPYFSLTAMASFAYNGFFESIRREFSGDRVKFMSVRVSMPNYAFSDDCNKKMEKLGFSFSNDDAAAKIIVEAFNNEKPIVIFDKKEKGLVFSNKFSNAGVDVKFQKIRTKILNAVSSNE